MFPLLCTAAQTTWRKHAAAENISEYAVPDNPAHHGSQEVTTWMEVQSAGTQSKDGCLARNMNTPGAPQAGSCFVF